MAGKGNSTEMLLEIPEAQRHRIVSGMRWTVWLSVFSVPFSFGTTIILARTSPEAVGTYGLLGVYTALILGLFYLGGDAVAIKFIPELNSEDRLSFLVSYFAVVCLAVLPWLATAAIWPHSLHYVLGHQASINFELFLLLLSPLPILPSLVSAALKGMLEMGWAQIVSRLATIASFLVYLAFFALSRSLLARSYTFIIWTTYLTVCVLGAAAGLVYLWCLNRWRDDWHSLRFFLPRGFWAYTLSLQQLSTLNFFTGRLDVILLLNFGGLTLLGKYVAIITLAESIRLISTLLIGTLLPSLTNTLAARNEAGAGAAFHTHMRILFLVNTASTCGLVLLSRPITGLLGAKYAGLSPLVILIALLIGLCAPGGVGGTLLSSIGKQQRAVSVAFGQIALYLLLFLLLWPQYQLLGAVMAYGIGWLASNAMLLAVARLDSPFPFSVTRDYVVFASIAVASALVARWRPLGIGSGLLIWLVTVGLYLVLARYTLAECRNLLHYFLPLSYFSSSSGPEELRVLTP